MARVITQYDISKRSFYVDRSALCANDLADAYSDLLHMRIACAAYWGPEMTALFSKELQDICEDRESTISSLYTGPSSWHNSLATFFSHAAAFFGNFFFDADQRSASPGGRYVWWMWRWPDLSIYARQTSFRESFDANLESLTGVGYLSPEALHKTLPNIIPIITDDELGTIVCELAERKVFLGGEPLQLLLDTVGSCEE